MPLSAAAAAAALAAVMVVPTSAALTQRGGEWALIQARGGLGVGGLTVDEWAGLQKRYESESALCGAFRPGFRADSVPGEAVLSAYGMRFRGLRAMEALLYWQSYPDVPVADVIYSAWAAEADLSCLDAFLD